jgi:predicted anti-sigma-YlaC factor YlaD
MSCHDVAAALVDESLPRPPDLKAHLERCAECRTLAGLHASASRLSLAEPSASAPLPPEAILGEVRRRQHRRRAVAGAATTAALATLVLLVLPRSSTVSAPGPVAPAEVAALAEESEPVSVGLLLGEVYGYTRANPTVEDETYGAFGALAAWVRPAESTALDSEPFLSVLQPLHPPDSLR